MTRLRGDDSFRLHTLTAAGRWLLPLPSLACRFRNLAQCNRDHYVFLVCDVGHLSGRMRRHSQRTARVKAGSMCSCLQGRATA